MTRFLRYILPSLADILFVSVFLYISFVPNIGLLDDGDTGYHVRAGEYILDTLSLPQIDPFSFITPALPWTVHEWLAEIFMAVAHRCSGISGVVVLYALILAATFYLVVQALKSQGNSALPAVAGTLLILLSTTVHWLARPHIFSFLLIVLWLYILDNYEYRDRNRLYLLPLLMLFWVNLHGGYIIGFVILCIYLAGNLLLVIIDKEAWCSGGLKRAKGYAGVLVICMATALLNPFGYKIFLFPFKLVFEKFLMNHVMEFLSPNFHEQPIFKALILLVILILALSRKRMTPVQIGLVLLFTNMSLYSVRYIPLFALITIPVMMRYIDIDFGSHIPRIRAFSRKRIETVSAMDEMSRGFLWPVTATLIVCFQLYTGSVVHGFDPKKKAVDAVSFMNREQIQGRMFNNDEIGDYIIYAAHRQYKVFIDGRLDMYGTERLKKYFKVRDISAGWEDILSENSITWIIFDTDTPFVRHLNSRTEWRLVYSDRIASIFVANTPMYAELIAKYPDIKLAKVVEEKKKN